MSFTQAQFDELIASVKNVSQLLERLEEAEPTEGDGFTQADLDKVIEALRALVPNPEV